MDNEGQSKKLTRLQAITLVGHYEIINKLDWQEISPESRTELANGDREFLAELECYSLIARKHHIVKKEVYKMANSFCDLVYDRVYYTLERIEHKSN